MYTNLTFDQFADYAKENNSAILQPLILQIRDFYRKINSTLERSTNRYKNAVVSILDQFPVKILTGVDGKDLFYVDNKPVSQVDILVSALRDYIAKFESIEYLDFLSEEKRNVVFVGPNGCGKTTLLRKLQQDTKGASIQYFPADRVLLVSENFNPKRSYDAFKKDFDESYKRSTNIDYAWQGNEIIAQFDYFINLLERERNEENEKRVYNGVTEKIIRKWHDLVKDRELFFEHGLCVRPLSGEKYPLKYMSSGEKSILYFLIGILLQEEKDFYFIDEPENNLNPSIVSKLWNFIERERPNSVFVYLTHDSDFVASRVNSKIYWIEKYDGQKWEWQQLKENKDLPQQLMIELVGSREPIIFCESENEYKYDSKVLKLMFPEFKVVSSGGCDQVIASIKAYNTIGLPQKVYGIVDCDYKMDDYLYSLTADGIYHLPFFEIENFLLSEELLQIMIETYCLEENSVTVVSNVKQKIYDLFVEQRDSWIAKHVAFDLRDKFDYRGKIKSLKDIEQLKALYNAERKSDDEIDEIAKKYITLHSELVAGKDYSTILRHLDAKGLIAQCRSLFKFGKTVHYEQQVFTLLNSDKGDLLLKKIRYQYLSEIKA